jgi:Uncharacterized conserved protein (DUF2183)
MLSLLLKTLLLIVWSEIKPDEQVVFFPTAAWYDEEESHWNVPIHGWIFEPEHNTWSREAVFDLLDDTLQFDEDSMDEKLFRRRSAWLMVDNERGKRVQIRLGESLYDLTASTANGHFHTTLSISAEEAAKLGVPPARDSWVKFSAVTQPTDPRTFSGQVQFVWPQGTSVVSDIDDTLKISDVVDKKKLLENTFLKPYQATPGMIEAMRHLSQPAAAFHYVSASPWQLFPELQSFTDEAGYPRGSWHLKSFRVLDRSFINLLTDPVNYKLAALEPILKRWPSRRFILIGDTGEKDPEVYGELARRYPEQIQKIWLRDVTGDKQVTARHQAAMRDVPAEKWILFVDGNEIVK